MVLKIMSNSLLALAVFFMALTATKKANATIVLQGSGYYGGMQQCPYPASIGREAISMSDEEKEERKKEYFSCKSFNTFAQILEQKLLFSKLFLVLL